MLPPSHWAYDPTLPPSRPYLARARALLAEAGFPNGLEIAFTGNADQRAQQQQEVLIEQFKRVGITTHWLRAPLGSGPFFRDKRGAALLTGWSGRPDPSMTFRSVYDRTPTIMLAAMDPTVGRSSNRSSQARPTSRRSRPHSLSCTTLCATRRCRCRSLQSPTYCSQQARARLPPEPPGQATFRGCESG